MTSNAHPSDRIRGGLFAFYASVIAFAFLLRLGTAGAFDTIQGILTLLIFNSFVGSLCLGLFLSYLGLPRKNGELALVLVVGLLCEAGLASYRLPLTDATLTVLMFGVGLGGCCLLFGMLPRFWSAPDADLRRRCLSPALILMSYFVGHFTVGLVAQLSPLVYDLYAQGVEWQIGVPASFWLRSWFVLHPSVHQIFRIVYGSLALAMVVTQLHFLARPARYAVDPTMSFVVLGTLGGILYFVCPIIGPAEFFSKVYPFQVPPWIEPAAVPFGSLAEPRNSMPSLHGAWALGCWWCTWSANRYLRISLGLFFLMTVPAALSEGHYLVDLLASFPLTLSVHALLIGLCHPSLRSRALASAGLALIATVAIPLSLRWGFWPYAWPAALIWLLGLALIVACCWQEANLRDRALKLSGAIPGPS